MLNYKLLNKYTIALVYIISILNQVFAKEVNCTYIQDTTLNAKVALWHNSDIRQSLLQNLIEDDDAPQSLHTIVYDDSISINKYAASILGQVPYLLMFNNDESEFVIASPSYGTCFQCWTSFYIGILSREDIEKNTHKVLKTNIPHFYTESGIHIGMNKSEVLALKGVPSKMTDSILKYYYISPQLHDDMEEYMYYNQQETGEMYMNIILNKDTIIGISYGYTDI